MLYKSILKVVGVVASVAVVAAVMFMGCDGDKGVDPNDPNYTYTGKTVIIGGKVWMAENLNRATANSKCYGNDASNCAKWGRLYTWAGAENACPAGWHLPSDAEWTVLTDYLGDIGDASTVGKRLKSTTGWLGAHGNGTDDYGKYAKFPFCIGHCVVKSMTYVVWLTPLFMKKRISITTNYYFLLRFVVAL